MNRDSPQTPPQIDRPLNAEEQAYLDQHMPRRLIVSPKRERSRSRSRSPTKRRRHGGKNRSSRKNRSLSRKQRR